MNLGINALNFCGSVKMNKEKIAKEIAKLEPTYRTKQQQEQIDSVIGNVNTLKERLENQTPDNCNYTLDLDIIVRDIYGYTLPDDLVVRVSDNTHGRKYAKKMSLVDVEPDFSRKNCRYMWENGLNRYSDETREKVQRKKFMHFEDGEAIWKKGFKEITERALEESNMSDKEVGPGSRMPQVSVLTEEEKAIFDRLA